MTLSKAEAKLRMEATKALGRAMNRVDRAFHHVLHNHRGRARNAIDSAELALQAADTELFRWQCLAMKAARPRKARKR